MRTGFKILISLIVALGLFAGLIFLTASGYKSIVETEIYQPAVVKAVYNNLGKIAEAAEEWHAENKAFFAEFLENAAVKRSVQQEQTAADIKMRDDASVKLLSSVPGLAGIRLIDVETQKIHFSTISNDILTQAENMISYKKYGKDENDIPLQFITAGENEKIKITADSAANTFLYCLPFFSTYGTYSGVAVFYVSDKSFLKELIAEKNFSLADNITVLTDTNYSMLGILTGLPYAVSQELKPLILSNWEKPTETVSFISLNNNQEWVLISRKVSFGYTGQICEKKLFLFPPVVKYFLIFAAVITVFLITFLLLNLKQDKFAAVSAKIQKLHLAILQNYIKNTESKNRKELQNELEYRRHDANAEIKKGLGNRFLKKNGKKVDEILQKSWEEIFSIINGKFSENGGAAQSEVKINNEELAGLLRQILEEAKYGSSAKQFKRTDHPVTVLQKEDTASGRQNSAEAEAVEELAELKEAAPAEQVPELDNAEPVEELTEIEDAEPTEELAELGAAEVDEDISEAEELEDIETAGELIELGGDEPGDEFEDFDDMEPLEEPAELGPVDLDAPMQSLNEAGYTISGLDFSDLNIPLSQFKKEEDDTEVEEVRYLDDNCDFQKPMWGKYREAPVQGVLDSAGGIEVIPLLDAADADGQTIINEDGIFVIKKPGDIQPENKDFKALVDSVLK